MSDPIVHIEFRNNRREEIYKHIKCLSLKEELSLVQLLDIEVFVYWNFNYKRQCLSCCISNELTSIVAEPYDSPQNVDEDENGTEDYKNLSHR